MQVNSIQTTQANTYVPGCKKNCQRISLPEHQTDVITFSGKRFDAFCEKWDNRILGTIKILKDCDEDDIGPELRKLFDLPPKKVVEEKPPKPYSMVDGYNTSDDIPTNFPDDEGRGTPLF